MSCRVDFAAAFFFYFDAIVSSKNNRWELEQVIRDEMNNEIVNGFYRKIRNDK